MGLPDSLTEEYEGVDILRLGCRNVRVNCNLYRVCWTPDCYTRSGWVRNHHCAEWNQCCSQGAESNQRPALISHKAREIMPKKCADPKVGKFLKAYHIGRVLKARDRKKFEIHLLECDFCWREFKRLQREDPQADK